MKKKLLAISLLLVAMFNLIGCNNVVDIEGVIKSPDTNIVDFELVDSNFYGAILVDKNTKVMYYWIQADVGGITPIYNADGSLKLYEE